MARQAFFCNSGAEANEAALKVARKATGRTRIVALDGGFHGRTLGALSATGQPGKWEGFGPLVPGSRLRGRTTSSRSRRPCPRVASSPRSCSSRSSVRAVWLRSTRPSSSSRGQIARELGALLVVDEVQTGLGRTGTFFAYEQLGLEPDLVTLAKGLGNGLPIGALLVREGVADAIGPGDHGSTFGGNPVTSAAACAVVERSTTRCSPTSWLAGLELADGLAALPGSHRRPGPRPHARRRPRP